MPKVLLVDDDEISNAIVQDWLCMERHVVEVVNNACDAKNMMRTYDYDVIILSMDLPDGAGSEICRLFKRDGDKTPILMLTGKAGAEKLVRCDDGADDCLTKPLNMVDLSDRVKALARQSPWLAGSGLKVRGIMLDSLSRTVTVNQRPVQLTAREFALLEFFMKHPDQIFSAEQLLSRVWPAESGSTMEALRQCMKRMRDRLAAAGDEDAIVTVRGVGYKLVKAFDRK